MLIDRLIVNEERLAWVLARPLRLDLLGFLMAEGPATASECARAIRDSPSNCSYHLRLLGDAGLVEPAGLYGRRRPWRATVTGFSEGTDLSPESLLALVTASMQLNVSLVREHMRTRSRLPQQWHGVEAHSTISVQVTAPELKQLIGDVHALLAPYRVQRPDAPVDAEHAHFTFTAFPRPFTSERA